jgi:hypothetical protein
MVRHALLALCLLLVAGPVRAWERGALKPGMTLSETRDALSAEGARMSGASTPGAKGVQVVMLTEPQPAQLKFCGGRLAGYSELIPGGIVSFLKRTEVETRKRGLALPRFSQFEQDGQKVEMIDTEWRDPAGGSVTLAWLSYGDTATGAYSVDGPCSLVASNPIAPSRAKPATAVAPPQKPANVKPVPASAKPVPVSPAPAEAPPAPAPSAPAPAPTAPAPASAPAPVTAPATTQPAATPDAPPREAPAPAPAASSIRTAKPDAVVVPVPSQAIAIPLPADAPLDPVTSGLALPRSASTAGETPARAIPRAAPENAPAAVRPKPAPKPPKPPVAASARGRQEPASGVTSTITPPGRPPQKPAPEPADPEATYATAAPVEVPPAAKPQQAAQPAPAATAAGPLRLPNAALAANPDDGELDAPPTPVAKPKPAAGKGWMPTTPEACGKAFKSYDPAKRTYRAIDGATRSCP